MKLFLFYLTIWLAGTSIVLGWDVPITYNGRKYDRSVNEESNSSQSFVPQTVPAKNINVKKDNIKLSYRSIKGERSFRPIIHRAASRYNIDPALVKAIILAESDYNPRAVSKKGAKGLMQLMPVTARSLGVDDAFNPEQNIHAGVRYFKSLLKQFDGDVKLALAAYNAGSSNVIHHKGIPPFKGTKTYLKKVYRYYEFYKKSG